MTHKKKLIVTAKSILLVCTLLLLLNMTACSGDDQGGEKYIPVDGILLSTASTQLAEGESLVLNASVTPRRATDQTLLMESSDVTVATVSPKGIVSAVKPGSVKITVTSKADPKVMESLELQVLSTDNQITSLSLAGHSAHIDQTTGNIVLDLAQAHVDVTTEEPLITVPEGADITPSPAEMDLLKEIRFTITSENGQQKNYTLNVYGPQRDQAALMALYNANPVFQKEVNWGIAPTLEQFELIGLNEHGRVDKLLLSPEEGLKPNTIAILPAQIAELTQLTSFVLAEQESLEELPERFWELTNLTRLTLYQNNLKDISPQIGNLSKLRSLNLELNTLTELPPEIANLTHLTELFLDRNAMTELPPEIGNLANLRRLRLSYNSLTELPPEIGNLVNLEDLDLSGNNLKEIPSELWYVTIGKTNLTFIELRDNPELKALPGLPDGLDATNIFLKLSLPEGFDTQNSEVLNTLCNSLGTIWVYLENTLFCTSL